MKLTVRQRIVDFLRDSGERFTQAEIANKLGLVKSSVRRECQHLERVGVIEQRGYSYDSNGPLFAFLTAVTADPSTELADPVADPVAVPQADGDGSELLQHVD